MRKIIWIVLLLIALLWIAIATYWTGTEKTEKVYDFPEASPTHIVADQSSSRFAFRHHFSGSFPASPIKVLSPTVTPISLLETRD
jgi:hypothetical protein